MKTSAILLTALLAGSFAFAQTPAPTEIKPAAADAPKVTETAAPADKAEQPADQAPAQKTATASAEAHQSSIEYVGADIQDVLRTLARQAGLNLVLGEDITGKVTISLVDVPYEKAIKLIADSKGYAVVKEENVIKVVSKASLAAEPLQEAVIGLEYMTATDAEKVVKPFLTQGRGSVTVDARSNSLVVSDVPAKLKQVTDIVAKIDTQTPQVMIEARIIESVKDPHQDYGIKWESLASYEVAAKNIGYNFNPTSSGFGLSRYKGGDPSSPIKDADVSVLTASDFKLVLSFLNSNADNDLLASPRIMTADNKEARIAIADQIPIPSYTFNQQTASLEISGFNYKDIGILLGVTPHINKNGYITLEVRPEVSNQNGSTKYTSNGLNADIPNISTRNVQANVLIRDGHTLALGGLIREDTANAYTKVPIMGDIPGLGAAFRSKNFHKTKKNLLIFITPTIVSPDGTAGVEEQIAAALKGSPDDNFANPKGWRDNAFPMSEQKSMEQGVKAGK